MRGIYIPQARFRLRYSTIVELSCDVRHNHKFDVAKRAFCKSQCQVPLECTYEPIGTQWSSWLSRNMMTTNALSAFLKSALVYKFGSRVACAFQMPLLDETSTWTVKHTDPGVISRNAIGVGQLNCICESFSKILKRGASTKYQSTTNATPLSIRKVEWTRTFCWPKR